MPKTPSFAEWLRQKENEEARSKKRQMDGRGRAAGAMLRGEAAPKFQTSVLKKSYQQQTGRKPTTIMARPPEAQVDETAERELIDYLWNTGSLYPMRLAIIENLRKKSAAGKYEIALAAKAWMHWVDRGAKEYIKEFAPGSRVDSVFDAPTRRSAAFWIEEKHRFDNDAHFNPTMLKQAKEHKATPKKHGGYTIRERGAKYGTGWYATREAAEKAKRSMIYGDYEIVDFDKYRDE